eukprot:TRINITY_DN13513_c0_g1_i1.p1 TRINITY_DN13513_c0_g1~~TRINITY_DN13513_c0_g1_i1.p1  ORF type:complete len:208 (+),score=44.18 TRINITY_DN13513_c0_g1_i1:49-672(+)
MSKPFARRLLEAFEKHEALQMPADDFLFVLRRVDKTLSANVGALLITMFSSDVGGYVDVQKFCAWFDDSEQAPIADASESEAKNQPPLRFNSDIGKRASDAEGASSAGCACAEGEVIATDCGVGELADTWLGDEGDEPCRRSLRFSQQVEADDDSFWSLGGQDKYTLPSHRVLTERERLLAEFRTSLNQVNDRLKSAPVKLTNHLRG